MAHSHHWAPTADPLHPQPLSQPVWKLFWEQVHFPSGRDKVGWFKVTGHITSQSSQSQTLQITQFPLIRVSQPWGKKTNFNITSFLWDACSLNKNQKTINMEEKISPIPYCQENFGITLHLSQKAEKQWENFGIYHSSLWKKVLSKILSRKNTKVNIQFTMDIKHSEKVYKCRIHLSLKQIHMTSTAQQKFKNYYRTVLC